jgi:hypothetical protein
MGCVGWYNGGMKRTLTIDALPSDPKGICSVWVSQDNIVIHSVDWVNYGIAITNIMQEWDASSLKYTNRAKRKFLGDSSCNLTPNKV